MYCPKCNREVQEGAAFCHNCGHELARATPVVVKKEQIVIVEEKPSVIPYQKSKPSIWTFSFIMGIAGGVLSLSAIPLNLLSLVPVIGMALKIIPISSLVVGIFCSLIALVMGIKEKKAGGSPYGIVLAVVGLIIGGGYIAVQLVIGALSILGVVGIGFLAIVMSMLGM